MISERPEALAEARVLTDRRDSGGCIEDQSRRPMEAADTGSGHGIWRGRRTGLPTAPVASNKANDAPQGTPILTSGMLMEGRKWDR